MAKKKQSLEEYKEWAKKAKATATDKKEYREAKKRLLKSQGKYLDKRKENTVTTNKDKGNISRGKVSEKTKRARRAMGWNVSDPKYRKPSKVITRRIEDLE